MVTDSSGRMFLFSSTVVQGNDDALARGLGWHRPGNISGTRPMYVHIIEHAATDSWQLPTPIKSILPL